MADIENRIAEMLSEKVSDTKQAVLMKDVDHVISIMGKPEEFAGENTQAEAPKKEPSSSGSGKTRRVFRDPDSKILGGVCSGIGAYFNMDPLWLRLALVVCFFAFGTGFLLYIILWIVIPEAKTSAEKLEMRGEDVNFSNIGKKVEEEIHAFGKKAENWGASFKQNVNTKSAGSFIQKFITFLESVLGGFLKVFVKLLGVFMIVIGLALLVSIFGSMFGSINIIHTHNFSYAISDFYGSFFGNEKQELIASIAVLLFVGIPLVMLVYAGFKLLLGIRKGNRLIGLGAGILWVIGLGLAIYSSLNIADQFSDEASSKQVIPIAKTKCDTLYLRVKEIKEWDNEQDHNEHHMSISIHKRLVISVDSANTYFGFPTIDIVRGETDSTEIVVYNEARGRDRKEALHFADNISYSLFQKDSLIEFMPYYSIPKDEKWRAQDVHVEIRLPKGKIVYLGKSMKHILWDIKNETDTWDGDMVSRRWIMGPEELRCLDCTGLEREKRGRWKKYMKEETSKDENDSNGKD